jgi:integrase
VRELGETPLNQLTTAQIQAAIHHLEDDGGRKTDEFPEGRPLAPKTVRHMGTLLFTCLSEAERLSVLKIPHPMANERMKLPKLAKRQPTVLDKDKLRDLFDRARGTRQYTSIVTAAATGCRRGELLALRWGDVNTESAELTVSKSLEQTKAGLRVKGTKSGEERTFSIPDWALTVLEEHRKEQSRDRAPFGDDYDDHQRVFCQPQGAYYSPDRIGARVVELMRKVGLEDVSLHSLRHSHASELLSRGVPIAAVSERLGHADQNITLSIYSHALPADTRAAAKVWNDAMADVIDAASKPGAPRMFAHVCTEKRSKSQVIVNRRRGMAGTTGLEPATSDVTGRRSNQLNYVPDSITSVRPS